LFVLLIIIFWKIQILDYKKYWKLSESNRKRQVCLPSPRGLIVDCNGVILARNVASFKASVIRENCRDYEASCQKIAHILNLKTAVLKERIKKYQSLPLSIPIVVKDNLSFEEVSRIEARKIEMPELILQSEPKRYYPHGSFAAHVLGYLQELSPEDIKSRDYLQRQLGDLIGTTGVEKQYDAFLEGQDGNMVEIVDSLGRRKGEISRKEPIQGNTLQLNLDFDLQERAEDLLQGREGAVVILDVKTGGILAMASYPDFNPNQFINRFTPEEWSDLIRSPEYPLENRTIRGLYAPGSIFKLTVALAALDLGAVNERTSYFCSGSTRIYGHPFGCWFKGGHGSVNLYTGIRNSCNIYFYQLGKKIGIEEIYRYATRLGFGKKTGVDLPGEKQGLVPNPQWKIKVKNEPWYPGETISVSIGQGPLLVTPLQVAVHTTLLANRGKSITPRIINENQSIGGEVRNSYSVDIQRSIFEKIIRGMWKVVNEKGTGRATKVSGYDVCGKTGSTQLVSTEAQETIPGQNQKYKTHSWFTGFAPRENPQVAVTVLVEYGGMGGATAAPLARHLFKLYREKYDR
jgi:penicillin-binding protein 2